MENQLELHRIGYHYVHNKGVNIDRPNGTNDYLFLYLKSNVCISTCQGEIQTTEPAFILYEKGFPQKYVDKKGPFVNDWIHFDGTSLNTFFQELDIPLNQIMVVQNATDISAMIQDLRVESKQQGKYHAQIIESKMKALFYKFSDIYHEERKFSNQLNRYRRDFNLVRNRIYTFHEERPMPNVAEVAESLNLSTSYFQHIYKQLFGVSIMNDIIKSRVEYACYLLANNADSISEIAFRCGYENKEHFSRQFKQITGYTPRQYREKR